MAVRQTRHAGRLNMVTSRAVSDGQLLAFNLCHLAFNFLHPWHSLSQHPSLPCGCFSLSMIPGGQIALA